MLISEPSMETPGQRAERSSFPFSLAVFQPVDGHGHPFVPLIYDRGGCGS